MRYQLLWRRISREAMIGNMTSVLPDYRFLQKQFIHNQYFLYNYAYELSEIGEYDRSLVIAAECCRIWADYHLQLIMADAHLKMERYSDAERHFQQAAWMCPARFTPPYKLVTLYMARGRTDDARDLASQILDKEIKVPSPVVYAIRREMRQLIESLTIKYPEK